MLTMNLIRSIFRLISKSVLLGICLFLCFGLLKSRQNPDQALNSIENTMDEQVQAWNRGSIEEYMQAYWKSDSLLFVGGSGMTYGWKPTLKRYLQAYPDREQMGKLSFDNKRIETLSDSTAFVLGQWQLQRTSDTLKGHYSLLWKMINREWKIIIDHSSSE